MVVGMQGCLERSALNRAYGSMWTELVKYCTAAHHLKTKWQCCIAIKVPGGPVGGYSKLLYTRCHSYQYLFYIMKVTVIQITRLNMIVHLNQRSGGIPTDSTLPLLAPHLRHIAL